ncbi:acetate/propionate family kinase [Namhaeicola litoreus]|uniref:Acetate kinase n=1 Tax=Namhaeicola litoreus TaxID=1052145 RepID=A0ABW3Y2E1_9FLAO
MNILVINSGSSSIKYQLFQMPEKKVICKGMVERIGIENGKIIYKTEKHSHEEICDIPDHKVGLNKIAALLMDHKVGVIHSADEIKSVGHRVVHGGNDFSDTVVIDEQIKSKIKELFGLAPLHNPPNYIGIEVAESIFPNAKQIAVFDTAFHQTIPEVAYRYAIPNKFLDENKIRLYGFHGTSHKYVTEKAISYLAKEQSKIITIHLGNGCSMTAVKNGKSIDHTLGFGPMNGLIMGTRSGDIDQSIIFYMINELGYSVKEVNQVLQKESGMFGLTGFSDLREIEAEAENGNQDCQMALQMNAYRIKKYIGSYAAILNGLDAIVFTAGIGENSDVLRNLVCKNMDFLGLELDQTLNAKREKVIREINTTTSKVKILIVPTDEELEIAQQSYEVLK